MVREVLNNGLQGIEKTQLGKYYDPSQKATYASHTELGEVIRAAYRQSGMSNEEIEQKLQATHIHMSADILHNRSTEFDAILNEQGGIVKQYKNMRFHGSGRVFNAGTNERPEWHLFNQFGDDENQASNDPNQQYDVVMMQQELDMMEQGLFPHAGIELECYVAPSKEKLKELIRDNAGTYKGTFRTSDLGDSDALKLDQYWQEVETRLLKAGVPLKGKHREGGIMQREIVVDHGSPAANVENWKIARIIMSQVAKEQGMYISDSPAPLSGVPGNGAHLNYSVFTTDNTEILESTSAAVQRARTEHPRDIRKQYAMVQEQISQHKDKVEFKNILAPTHIGEEKGVGYIRGENQNPLTIIILDEIAKQSHAMAALITSIRGFRRVIDDPNKSAAGREIGAATLLPTHDTQGNVVNQNQRKFTINMAATEDKNKARIELRTPCSESTFPLVINSLDRIITKVLEEYKGKTPAELEAKKQQILQERAQMQPETVHGAPNYLQRIADTVDGGVNATYTALIKKMHDDLQGKSYSSYLTPSCFTTQRGETSPTKELFNHLEAIAKKPETPHDFKEKVDTFKKEIKGRACLTYSEHKASAVVNVLSQCLAYEPMMKNLEALRNNTTLLAPEVKENVVKEMSGFFDDHRPYPFEGEFHTRLTHSDSNVSGELMLGSKEEGIGR